MDMDEVRALGFNVVDEGERIDPDSDLAKRISEITQRLLERE